jgi:hypothetical protein
MKSLFAIIIVGIFTASLGYVLVAEKYKSPSIQQVTVNESMGEPTFTWSYRESDKQGIPYSEINLTAIYANGFSQTKVIDTVEGGCNEYENSDVGVYKKSTMIMCYYAGLGRYFKIVSNEDGYEVQRKIFEEASPEYDPPHRQYETVTRF